MPFSHRPRRRLAPRGAGRRSHVSEHRPNEIDPSVFFGDASDVGPDRKTLQLCRQVARALSTALQGDCNDDVLGEVYVDTVEPAPDASRLLVIVRPFSSAVDAERVLERLRERKARLRAIAAEAITRKRTPELAFLVGGPAEGA
jgi:ribosome-binding factor A